MVQSWCGKFRLKCFSILFVCLDFMFSNKPSSSSSVPDKVANLSKEFLQPFFHRWSIAAWGQLQKRSEQSRANEKISFIRHWELGVFISPATLANNAAASGSVSGGDICIDPYPGTDASTNKNGVINLESDDEEDAKESSTVQFQYLLI